MNFLFCRVNYGTAEYEQTVWLRNEILRKPLNLHFSPEQLTAEKDQIHIACFSSITGQILACLILVPDNSTSVKMRQVAVAADFQQQGLGKKLVNFAENWAIEAGFTLMHCNARDTAVPFYHKLGYTTVGEPFTEVGIKHYYMEKVLRAKG